MDFHALRVLDIGDCEWLENKHVKHIGSSRQLRYLRIGRSKITELPGEIRKLQHLETLDLRRCHLLRRLPSTVVELQKLVRLFVSTETQLPADRFRSLQALEELWFGELWFGETDDPVRFAEEVKELAKCNLRCLRTEGEIAKYLFCNPCCTYPCLQVLKLELVIGMVPRGLTSLENLVELYMMVGVINQEGFQVLIGMPSLAHLQLCVFNNNEEKLTVGSNGFKLLKVFDFQYPSVIHSMFEEEQTSPGGLRLTFAPGAVPALRRLHLDLNPMWVASDFFADLGVEHLSVLAHLEVEIRCFTAAHGRAKALECSIEKAIKLNPDHEIHVSRVEG